MRVFTASLSCETNTFSPIPTGLAAFHERAYFPRGMHPNELLHCAGPLWAARQRANELGWELFEGLVASAMPGGTVTRVAYETLRDELLSDLEAALPVDIVLLGLHGAMVADGYADCEGDILARVRARVGPDAVIGAVLDPHCHLSEEMTRQSNILICFKEYPHTDILERSQELVQLCSSLADRKIAPVCAVADCKMIAVMHTSHEPFRSFVNEMIECEKLPGILSVSLVHGFPWGDVSDMGTKLLVYGDGDVLLANRLAGHLAERLCDLRSVPNNSLVDIDTALDMSISIPSGPIVLADSADNAGGGAPGDSTFILRRLIERGIASAAIGPIWDPIAVRLAVEAGVGARMSLRVGGKVAPVSGSPVDLICTVQSLKRDMVMRGLAGTSAPLGDCAMIDAGGILIVLASIRCQALDIDLFTQLGCDVRAMHLLIVKSSQHFYASFSQVATQTIYVDTPGALSMNLSALDYHNIQRPKWPLDYSGN